MSADLAKQGRAVGRDLNNGFSVTCERCFIIEQMADRIEELEAKLAKAVGALHEIAGKKTYADDPWGVARATLAELKGQDQ